MITKAQAKALKRPYTIDLAGIIEAEKEQELIKNGFIKYTFMENLKYKLPKISNFLIICGFCYLIWSIIGIYNTHADYEENYDYIIGCVSTTTHETRKPMEGTTNKWAKCYYGAGWQNITLNTDVLPYYDKYRINLTRKLDLLTISSVECGDKNGLCKRGTADLGPFQINQIHRKDYMISLRLYNLVGKTPYAIELLYKYQMLWTNKRMASMVKRGICSTYINKDRFKCQAKNHNGNKKIDKNGLEHRVNYSNKAWEVREYIKKWLTENDKIGYKIDHYYNGHKKY